MASKRSLPPSLPRTLSFFLKLLSSKYSAFAFHGILSDTTCKACDGLNPQCALTSQLSWMSPQKEERRALRPFFSSFLKALGPTQILYVSMAVFALPSECRVGLAAAMEGKEEGRGGLTSTLTKPTHTWTAPSMLKSSQWKGEFLNVFLIASFLVHYMTAL